MGSISSEIISDDVLQAVIPVLERETALYCRLAELAEQEYIAIVEQDVTVLETIIAETAKLSQLARECERRRQAITGTSKLTFGALVDASRGTAAEHLGILRAQLTGYVCKVQAANERNRPLLRALLSFLDEQLNELLKQNALYADTGLARTDAPVRGLVDRRA